MKNRYLAAAFLLLIVINALVLAGAVWNRTGNPDSVVTLTERELSSSYGGMEDSGIYLRLAWHYEVSDWFDAAKLRSIGYDIGIQPGSKSADLFYRKALPRRTFVVLEYEGNAWKNWIKSEEERVVLLEMRLSGRQATDKQVVEARKSLEYKKSAVTRLFPVDVGNDPRFLRDRYPERNRYIVAPAEVRLIYEKGPDQSVGKKPTPAIHGRIDAVMVSEIAVSRATAGPILKLLKQGHGLRHLWNPDAVHDGPPSPRFQAVVTFGRRHEPWVVSMAPL
jgi:hypothetical protein